MGLNYKEIGEKGGMMVTLSEHGTTVQPVNFNEVQWEAIDFELNSAIETLYDLEMALYGDIAEHISDLGYSTEKLIVRVHVYGRSKCYHSLRDVDAVAALETALCQRLHLLDVNLKDIGLASDYDLKALEREQTVLAMALELLNSPEAYPELLERLYQLPMFKTVTTAHSREALLRERMDSIRAELVDRMLKVPDEN
jgi:hypothetical protein